MNNPEIFILPVLMIADYYLTIYGSVLREKTYARHFVIETYEMNPDYRAEIDAKSVFNFRFAGQVISNTLLLFLIGYFLANEFPSIYQAALGFYLILFAYINGLHVSNILTFLSVNRDPGALEGSVNVAHIHSLRNSLFSTSVIFVPIVFVLIFSFSYFALGGVIAILYKAALGISWIIKSKRAKD